MMISLLLATHVMWQANRGLEVRLASGVVAVSHPDTNSYGSIFEIRRGDSVLSRISLRTEIDRWLQSDAVWGGRALANEMRYEDNPTSTATQRLQGKVYEIVPWKDGCLVRVGLVNTSPSQVREEQDFILRWKATDPSHLTIIDRSASGNSFYDQTLKLPRFKGTQFLVGDNAVYRLEGLLPAKKMVAKLPIPKGNSCGWMGIRLAGSSLTLELPVSSWAFEYRKIDLATGKLGVPSMQGLQSEGVRVSALTPDHKLPQPGQFPLRFSYRWPPRLPARHDVGNWGAWIKLAKDKGKPDLVRATAIDQLGFLAASWGSGPWSGDAIAIVAGSIQSGTDLCRAAALRDVRIWTWKWPAVVRQWSSSDMNSLRAILRNDRFRKEMLNGAIAEGGNEMSSLLLGMGSKEVGVNSFERTLAISGSPAALPFLRSKIGSKLYSVSPFLESVGYLKRAEAEPYLYSLVGSMLKLKPLDRSSQHRDIFEAIVADLFRMGVRDYSRLLSIAEDRKRDWRIRVAMFYALATFANPSVERAMEQATLDSTEPDSFRSEVLFAFRNVPDPAGKSLLGQLAAKLPPGDLKSQAQSDDADWVRLSSFAQRRRENWGFESRIGDH